MFDHDTEKEAAFRLSRFDIHHPLASASQHSIELEGRMWRTAEHYVWHHLVARENFREKVRDADTARQAFVIANRWYRSKVDNWKGLRKVYMTRALYTKVQMYPEVEEVLMSSSHQLIIETSLYDHYWGIGRDQRGENMFGKIWMDIRTKIREK